MKLTKKNLSEDGLTLMFSVEQTTPALINSIRRSIAEEVPTMAIEEVEFRQNTSAMFDEMLAHRLGLVPLKTDLSSYAFKEDEASAANQCSFTLEATGPSVVTTKSLQSADPTIVPVHSETILLELLEGQSVVLEAKAILGRGKDHAKWSSGLAYYTAGADVSVTPGPELDEVKDKLPQQVFDANGKVSAELIMKNGLVDAVDGVCPQNIVVTYDQSRFDVTVESWGQLPVVTVVQQAVHCLQEGLDDFKQALEALK